MEAPNAGARELPGFSYQFFREKPDRDGNLSSWADVFDFRFIDLDQQNTDVDHPKLASWRAKKSREVCASVETRIAVRCQERMYTEEIAMADKNSFTPDEWTLLLESP